MSEVRPTSLTERQRGLLALLKMRQSASPESDSYLSEVADSQGLKALREIDLFWKEYSLRSRCPFTSELMRRQGVLREEVMQLIRDEKLSAFVEELGRQFLDRASRHPETLVATLARFESALASTADGDCTEYRIEWTQDPYYVLGCLLQDRPIESDQSRGCFVTVVASSVENRFRVEELTRGVAAALDAAGR